MRGPLGTKYVRTLTRTLVPRIRFRIPGICRIEYISPASAVCKPGCRGPDITAGNTDRPHALELLRPLPPDSSAARSSPAVRADATRSPQYRQPQLEMPFRSPLTVS